MVRYRGGCKFFMRVESDIVSRWGRCIEVEGVLH